MTSWPGAVRPCEKTKPDWENTSVCSKEEGSRQNFHFNQNALQLPNMMVAVEVVV